jgi:hypothetical protein
MQEASGPHVVIALGGIVLAAQPEKVRSFFQKPSFKYRFAPRLIARRVAAFNVRARLPHECLPTYY